MKNRRPSTKVQADRKANRVEVLEIQVLRLEGRRLTRSLYGQLPREDVFQFPSKWHGKAWARAMLCPPSCEGTRGHLHVIWQKRSDAGPTARLAIFKSVREGRRIDLRLVEAAEEELAQSLTVYVAAALASGHQAITLDQKQPTYVVYGPWVEGRELSGPWRPQLPYELDEWLCGDRDLEDWERPSRYRLVAIEPRAIRIALPTALKKRLEAEITPWRGAKEAFRATARRVNESLRRLKGLETALVKNDEAWAQAYQAMERLPEIFI